MFFFVYTLLFLTSCVVFKVRSRLPRLSFKSRRSYGSAGSALQLSSTLVGFRLPRNPSVLPEPFLVLRLLPTFEVSSIFISDPSKRYSVSIKIQSDANDFHALRPRPSRAAGFVPAEPFGCPQHSALASLRRYFLSSGYFIRLFVGSCEPFAHSFFLRLFLSARPRIRDSF